MRESTKKQGQYVLTGMASGKIQHLLLMDRHGKVGVVSLSTILCSVHVLVTYRSTIEIKLCISTNF